jgi:hypothetical protein
METGWRVGLDTDRGAVFSFSRSHSWRHNATTPWTVTFDSASANGRVRKRARLEVAERGDSVAARRVTPSTVARCRGDCGVGGPMADFDDGLSIRLYHHLAE